MGWRFCNRNVVNVFDCRSAFTVAAPHFCNMLPADVIVANSLSTFRWLLKRFYPSSHVLTSLQWLHHLGHCIKLLIDWLIDIADTSSNRRCDVVVIGVDAGRRDRNTCSCTVHISCRLQAVLSRCCVSSLWVFQQLRAIYRQTLFTHLSNIRPV